MYLYVMISSTSTHMGKAIQKVTRFPYNHVSLTLDPTFQEWTSFARVKKETPFVGGLVEENIGRFESMGRAMPVRLYRIPLEDAEFRSLVDFFEELNTKKQALTYNSYGAIASAVHLNMHIVGSYTCLQFANVVLNTRFTSIQKLSRDLEEFFYWEGDFFSLVSGMDPADPEYLEKISHIQVIWQTFQHFRGLTTRMIRPGRFQDPIVNSEEFHGIDLSKKRSSP